MELTRRNWFLSFAVLTQIVFWLVTFFLVYYVSVVNYQPHDAVTRFLLIAACHLTNFYVCYSFLVPRYYEKGHRLAAFAGLLMLLIVLTPLRNLIEHHFIASSLDFRDRFFNGRNRRGTVLFSELFIAAVASLLRLAVSNEEKQTKMAALENLHLQTELRFLKAQMNPHFLFNTINNIYSLTLLKSDKASTALMKLSGLLRYMLYESSGKVTLQQEMEALRAYVELFQLRFEQKLAIEIIYEVNQAVEMESLLLIPLLENALKHSGIGVQPATVFMKLSMPEKNRLVISVNNTKANPPVLQDAGGIGLVNIQKRLQLVYPLKHTLIIDENDRSFSITLSILIA
ncbi:sensor histidine kinase [Niastella vici]|nr:sensor histidine kinase [Niastella vici]